MYLRSVRLAVRRFFARLFMRPAAGRPMDRGTMSAQWVAAQRAGRQDR
ncbi:MAG: hypothetical protein IT181_14410 [Acidobacteria bacterium]|nr:hypothetical protein [Acidobacteriota bacterium]